MTPADIDRVFGRSRLRMVTGDHVEVFREQSLPGERRRYTKRFLATSAGDFREWTEREWRILARLVGHGIQSVPDVVQFDRGSADRPALVQTYDAGITVDHWATLLPLERDGTVLPSVFEDSAHWWALARHSLIALDAIHELQLVHLDLKADNICIPAGPADFDPLAGQRSLHPRFEDLTLIDFAFSLVSGEQLQSALPIAAQQDYPYQSPRLLRALEAGRVGDLSPTRRLDWRCDFFSLAAMLSRYLPELDDSAGPAWTRQRHAKARSFVRRLLEWHDAELPNTRPHAELIAVATESTAQPDLRHSLQQGWTLAIETGAAANAAPTPVTRIALPLATPMSPAAPALATPVVMLPSPIATPAPFGQTRRRLEPWVAHGEPAVASSFERAMSVEKSDVDLKASTHRLRDPQRARRWWWTAGLATAAAASAPFLVRSWTELHDPAVVPTARLAKIDPTSAPAPAAPPRAQAPAHTVPPAPIVASVPAPIAALHDAATVTVAGAPSVAAPSAETSAPAQATSDGLIRPAPRPTEARSRPAVTRSRPALATTTRAAPFPAAQASPQRFAKATLGHGTALSNHTSAPLARTAAAPHGTRAANAASAFPSRQLLLFQAQVRARAQLEAQARAQASAPTSTPATTPTQGIEPAIPWAVAGKAPPLGTASPQLVGDATSGSSGVVSPASFAGGKSGTAAQAALAPLAPRPSMESAASLGTQGGPVAAAPASAVPADFGARADKLMVDDIPRLAQRAQRFVSKVLFVAGRSGNVVGDREILEAAAALEAPSADAVSAAGISPRDAQQLDQAARNEFARRGATTHALMLQVQAFGANPLDAEVAGDLAFLLLRQRPSQPEGARQLALYALTLHGTRFPHGRAEDWTTLAIANALTGRDRDARNALLVSLAVAPNLERQCRVSIDIYSMYGERLRTPAEAALYSAQASGRATQGSACGWPPPWTVSSGTH